MQPMLGAKPGRPDMTSGDTTAARKRRANFMGGVYRFYSLKRGDDQANETNSFKSKGSRQNRCLGTRWF
jgi:hypothetical protein